MQGRSHQPGWLTRCLSSTGTGPAPKLPRLHPAPRGRGCPDRPLPGRSPGPPPPDLGGERRPCHPLRPLRPRPIPSPLHGAPRAGLTPRRSPAAPGDEPRRGAATGPPGCPFPTGPSGARRDPPRTPSQGAADPWNLPGTATAGLLRPPARPPDSTHCWNRYPGPLRDPSPGQGTSEGPRSRHPWGPISCPRRGEGRLEPPTKAPDPRPAPPLPGWPQSAADPVSRAGGSRAAQGPPAEWTLSRRGSRGVWRSPGGGLCHLASPQLHGGQVVQGVPIQPEDGFGEGSARKR